MARGEGKLGSCWTYPGWGFLVGAKGSGRSKTNRRSGGYCLNSCGVVFPAAQPHFHASSATVKLSASGQAWGQIINGLCPLRTREQITNPIHHEQRAQLSTFLPVTKEDFLHLTVFIWLTCERCRLFCAACVMGSGWVLGKGLCEESMWPPISLEKKHSGSWKHPVEQTPSQSRARPR